MLAASNLGSSGILPPQTGQVVPYDANDDGDLRIGTHRSYTGTGVDGQV